MTKKRILVIGCSHSKQYNDKVDPFTRWSWAELMQQKLHDRGYDTSTTNTAQYSNSIYGQWHNLQNCLEWKPWDIVILQFTGVQRQTYVEDELVYRENLFKMTPGWNGVPNYYDWNHETSVSDYKTFKINKAGFLHLNAGTATFNDRTSEYKEAYLTNCLYSLSESTPMVVDIHLLIEKEMIRLVREQYGIPTIVYRHDHHDHWDAEYMNKHLDFCAALDLPDYKHLVDIGGDGSHLGLTGNRALVNTLIMPRVVEILDK